LIAKLNKPYNSMHSTRITFNNFHRKFDKNTFTQRQCRCKVSKQNDGKIVLFPKTLKYLLRIKNKRFLQKELVVGYDITPRV
jgi:hypothetical protein